MVEQIFLQKNIFRKRTSEGVAGVLTRIFTPLPGGDPPPRVSTGRVRQVRIFSEKCFKKKSNLAKQMVKKNWVGGRFVEISTKIRKFVEYSTKSRLFGFF